MWLRVRERWSQYVLGEGTYKDLSSEEIWELSEASSDARHKLQAVVNRITCLHRETRSFEEAYRERLKVGHPVQAWPGQDVGALLGNLHGEHNILRALAFLACQNFSCKERVKNTFLEIHRHELDRSMYDRTLSSKKCEYQNDIWLRKFSDPVEYSAVSCLGWQYAGKR